MELTPVQLNWQDEVVVIGKLIYRPSNCLSGENVFEKKPDSERAFCNHHKHLVVVKGDKCLDICHLRNV